MTTLDGRIIMPANLIALARYSGALGLELWIDRVLAVSVPIPDDYGYDGTAGWQPTYFIVGNGWTKPDEIVDVFTAAEMHDAVVRMFRIWRPDEWSDLSALYEWLDDAQAIIDRARDIPPAVAPGVHNERIDQGRP